MVSIYKHCQNCQKTLPADSTWRRKFCSDLCRVQFHRKPTPNDLYNEAITTIDKFKKTAKKDRVQAIDSLKALKVAIDNALGDCGDKEMLERRAMMEDLFRKRTAATESPSDYNHRIAKDLHESDS